MANDIRIFLTDDIPAQNLNQQILGRNFQGANREIDGSTMKQPFRSTMNVMDMLQLGDDLELTIVSNKAEIKVDSGVAYLDYIGEAVLYIFPKDGNPDDGIRINLEIYAKDGVDLAYALGEDKYDTIFLGEGVYPGMVVTRPVRIAGCGLATMIIPYDEYKNGYNVNDYKVALGNGIARANQYGLGDGMVQGDCCGNDVDLALGLGLGMGRPCNQSPLMCANAFANGNTNNLGIGSCGRILGNGCGLRENNNNRYYNGASCGNVNPNCAVVRVACDNVLIEDISIVSLDSHCDVLIGLAFASPNINTRIANVAAYRVAVALDKDGLVALGMYAAGCDNVAVVDGMIDIGDGVDAGVSIGVCNVAGAKLDGLFSNARLFVGNCGCNNQIDFATGITIVEDITAIEGNGATLKYGELPAGDVEGAVRSILRDGSNNFDNLGMFLPEYPEYKAIYLGSMMRYAILVNVGILGCH